MFSTSRHWTLFWATLIQHTSLQPIASWLISLLDLTTYKSLGLPSQFPTKSISVALLVYPCVLHAPHISPINLAIPIIAGDTNNKLKYHGAQSFGEGSSRSASQEMLLALRNPKIQYTLFCLLEISVTHTGSGTYIFCRLWGYEIFRQQVDFRVCAPEGEQLHHGTSRSFASLCECWLIHLALFTLE